MNEKKEITNLLSALPYEKCKLSQVSVQNPALTLYIIGNGFDLMHGVPSSYYKFRDFLGEQSELRKQLETWNLKEELWADFEDSLAYMDGEGLLETVPDMMEVMGVLDKEDDDFSAADFFAAAEWSVYPLQVIQNELPKQLRKWISSLQPMNSAKPLASLICKEGQYINFNYTEFIESIYNVTKENILYIHGDRRDKKQELILGHALEAESNSAYNLERRKPHIYNQTSYDMYKTASRYVGNYYDSTEKKTDEIIMKHKDYFDGLSDIENIVVIGHSLSYVDYSYFREIVNKTDKVKWNIGWYSLSDLKRIREFVVTIGVNKEQIVLFRT